MEISYNEEPFCQILKDMKDKEKDGVSFEKTLKEVKDFFDTKQELLKNGN